MAKSKPKSFPKLKKKSTAGGKTGVQLRIATLAKYADEAMKVVVADKGKSAPKAIVEKVKAKMDPPSKARVAVAIALSAKELGKKTEEVATAFMTAKLFKGTLKKFTKKFAEGIDEDVVTEVESMMTAVYKFIESTYSLGRRKKGDREMADEVDDEPRKPKKRAAVEEEEEEEAPRPAKSKKKAVEPEEEEEEEEEEDDDAPALDLEEQLSGLEPDDDQPKPKVGKKVVVKTKTTKSKK
jgi:hypothetical protein